jgi:hypothetical protein
LLFTKIEFEAWLLLLLLVRLSMLLRLDIVLKVERLELEEFGMGEETPGFVEEDEEAPSPPKGRLLSGVLPSGGMGLGNFASTFARVARSV